MTTEELAELFLAHLYELAEEAPHPNFLFSVNDFAPKLGLTGREELQKAINYLGDRGFIILASFDWVGGISAGITIEGSVFVEKGGETGVIQRHRRTSQTSTTTPSVSAPPPINKEKTGTANGDKQGFLIVRRAVGDILDDIEHILERDDTVAVATRKDFLFDIATLKIQMERNVKNRQIIDAILVNLSNLPSIAPLVTGLSCIVKTYFE